MSTPQITITHFTDPTCPFAFSAEPRLRRLEWELGDAATWRLCMVGLIDDPATAAARGFTPARLSAVYADFASRYGMPFSTAPLERLYASLLACRAVVATRRHAPDHEVRLLRAFRVRHFAGRLVDDPATLPIVAGDAGLDATDLAGWIAEPTTHSDLERDLAAARAPSPAARAQDARLGDWDGGRRYTCPSLEFAAGGDTMSAPGFQPQESYDLAIANLRPDLARRAPAGSVIEVLRWAPFPLATAEVAAVCGVDQPDAAAQLATVAERIPVGTDAYWQV